MRLACLFLLFSLLGLFGIPLSAQSRAFDCSSPAKNERDELLGRIQNEYGKIKSLKATFLQDSFLSALESSEPSSGEMWFVKPGKMKWHYTKPEEQVFIIKDQTLWLYQALERQAIIDDISQILISDLPVAFLMGIGDLKRDFMLNSSCHSPEGLVLDLKPKSEEEKNLKGFLLLVHRDTFFPIGAKVTDVGGNVTSIVFNQPERNVSISEHFFAPSFPKGTDVQDRRGESRSSS